MTITQEKWTAVDRYLTDLFAPPDTVLDAALQSSADAGLPNIQVAPNQGKLISILAQAIGARSILEIGTLGGYSTIWLARALPPGGRLITLEFNPKHAEVARRNVARAGFADRVEIRVGSALDLLPQLAAEGRAPFDLVFIDADTLNTPAYFDWAIRLSRRGSMIIIDNVVQNGKVADADSDDPYIQALRRISTNMAGEARTTSTVLQTVGGKGYDGLAISLVIGD